MFDQHLGTELYIVQMSWLRPIYALMIIWILRSSRRRLSYCTCTYLCGILSSSILQSSLEFLLHSVFIVTMSTVCYFRSGASALTKTAPCNQTALLAGQHTSCCMPGEQCLTGGFCRKESFKEGSNFLWRGGCTDRTWRDPACPDYCDGELLFCTRVSDLEGWGRQGWGFERSL
jgi:hypothetical protein